MTNIFLSQSFVTITVFFCSEIQDISQGNKMTCVACFLGKLIVRPSLTKIDKESLKFLEKIQGDIYGPIHPPCDHSTILWY